MEAMTLCIPPTLAKVLLKDRKTQTYFTVSNVFKAKAHSSNFLYGMMDF
jgi:hypothetical protein